ncbi:MAG: PorP/SprF family type IX secretion system membrane protein [Sphingobacteriales bacterium]
MKKLKNSLCILCLLLTGERIVAQDPSFSQFFASPLNINPALTGNINEKWRLISNYRNQWSGVGNPYSTGTISADNKIFQNLPGNYVDENTRIAIGGMMMYDEAMGGALKSNYASFNVSGNVRLATGNGYEQNGAKIRHLSKIKMDQGAEQRLGVGIGIAYGNRRLDVSKLNFAEQFNGSGFDTNLPTGETALSNMKPYLSTSAGLLYSYITDNSNFDLGVSAFHFNKPKQTFLNDPNQFLATRYVVHANFEKTLTDQVVFNSNGIYQYQSGASYFSIGGAFGYSMQTTDEKDMIINAGLWYWSNNAVIPYVGFSYENYQVGLTYDMNVSKLSAAARRAQTFELCLIIRGGEKPSSGVIPAPWK